MIELPEILSAERIVAIVNKHDGDLVRMWNTEVVEGTLSVDSCMDYVLKAEQLDMLRWFVEWLEEHQSVPYELDYIILKGDVQELHDKLAEGR